MRWGIFYQVGFHLLPGPNINTGTCINLELYHSPIELGVIDHFKLREMNVSIIGEAMPIEKNGPKGLDSIQVDLKVLVPSQNAHIKVEPLPIVVVFGIIEGVW